MLRDSDCLAKCRFGVLAASRSVPRQQLALEPIDLGDEGSSLALLNLSQCSSYYFEPFPDLSKP